MTSPSSNERREKREKRERREREKGRETYEPIPVTLRRAENYILMKIPLSEKGDIVIGLCLRG